MIETVEQRTDLTDFGGLYLRMPSPEYRLAFDYAAQALSSAPGRCLASLSSTIHLVELLKCCPFPVDIAGGEDLPAEAIDAWRWGAVRTGSLEEVSPVYDIIVWAEPEADNARRLARQLRQVIETGGLLLVLATSGPRRFLPAWNAQPHPAHAPLSPRQAARLLSASGWQVTHRIGLHGPRAVAWRGGMWAAQRFGRADWADRCRLAMQAHYTERGALAWLTPLTLITARAI